MENKKQIFLNSDVDWFEAQLMIGNLLGKQRPCEQAPPPVLLLTVAAAGRLFPPLSI